MQTTQETISTNSNKVGLASENGQSLGNGPLYSMFPCSTSKVLDFMITFHRYDYSVSDIAKNSGVTFKTGLNEVRKLEKEGIITFTRKVGKATMFQLAKTPEADAMRMLALKIANRRIDEEIKKQSIEN